MNMMGSVGTLVAQGAVFAGLYGGVYALRRLTSEGIHPSVQAHPEFAQYPELAKTLTHLARVDDGGDFDALMTDVLELLRRDSEQTLDAQWHMSRIIPRIAHKAKWLCESPAVRASDERYRAALTGLEETVPLLETQLDDVLHNHLLKRQDRR